MTCPEDANAVLTDGLIVFQKHVYADKCKKEPTQCLKCHSWGHLSYDCQQPFSTCGTCASHHRTPECTNCDRPRCVSCRMDGHPSCDCRCPAFLNKCHNMDMRMTENQMPYYPTADCRPMDTRLTPTQTYTPSIHTAMNAATLPIWSYRRELSGGRQSTAAVLTSHLEFPAVSESLPMA